MKPIRVAAITPLGDDPTSWYRGIGPLSALQKKHPHIQILFPNPVNWATLKLCDVLFMQRPFNQDHVQTLYMAKELGLPVWIDFDDENLSVPKSNPMFGVYGTNEVKSAIVNLIRNADVVTVATEGIRKKYSIYSEHVTVLPNAIDDSVLEFKKLAPKNPNKLVLWRGSQSHLADFDWYEGAIVEVAGEFPEHCFGFFGLEPYRITDRIRNYRVYPFLPIIDYLKAIVQLRAQASYYFLGDKSDHCRFRSHVAWLEASFAGSPLLVSKAAEFDRAGAIQFESASDFKTKLKGLLSGEINTEPLVKAAWEEIEAKYMLSHVNETRLAIIEGLTQRTAPPP